MRKFVEAQLEGEFIETSLRRTELLRRRETVKANREYDKIHRLKEKLRTLPDRGEAVLKRIAMLDDPETRMLAAAGLLAIDEPHALRILEAIASGLLGTTSFTAEMTVREWKNGALKAYWG